MKNGSDNQTDQNTESTEISAAKLAFIGSALSTFGDGLQAIAAGIILQELEKTNNANQNTPNELDQTSQLEIMQKQIDHLTSKIERMESRDR